MRIFGVILTILVFGFIGFVSTALTVLSRDAKFYGAFVPILTIGLIIIVSLAIYGQMKKKIIRYCAIIFISLCAVSVIAYEGYQAYLTSLEVVSTQDVDLSEYQPFTGNTKAVSLDEEATYKIKNNLPKLDGATALYPVYSAFVQAVYTEKDYPLYDSEIVSSQTNVAFGRLLKGEVDIIFIAHPSENQMKKCRGPRY
ncbi:hypothetical protein ACLM5H_25365 [Fredinandcohnia humi]